MTDTDILHLLAKGDGVDATSLRIVGFDDVHLTPLGYDLRAGKTVQLSGEKTPHLLNESDSVFIAPGQTALIETLEEISMPREGALAKSLSGMIFSKVSAVSRGLSHISTTVDPDWHGRLLIAVHNHANYPIKIAYGDAICTLSFIENKTKATRFS
ncbi:MAG: hypothetical protein AAFR74_08860, partial [Pseudomonadota bacterium]